MEEFEYPISDRVLFEQNLLEYFKDYKNVVFLNSNTTNQTNYFAVSNSDEVFDGKSVFGFISYDYKNQIEKLSSSNIDGVNFPDKHFFTPEILFKIDCNVVKVSTLDKSIDFAQLIAKIETAAILKTQLPTIKMVNRISKESYIETVNQLKNHIQLGDIYEVNYCQEYYAENVDIDPIKLYDELNKKSPTPFSCFLKCDEKYLICASPERFIKKEGVKIISQPIKGTIKRGKTELEDNELKKQLASDAKERSENIMIVDLVRNDLSKIAKRNTVVVEELCEIYTFPQVHQMISTIAAEMKDNTNFNDTVKATFPMGSMTGAPKIRAMKLIEQYEQTKRGLYAGTVGYIDEKGDFDFNVVIRSLLYNRKNNYLSFIVGGAITSKSDPEKEYQECLLKAKAMLEVLNN